MATKPRETRPLPWMCSNCATRTVVPTVIDYTAKIKHDGVIHELHMRGLKVPRCQTCGQNTITTAVDERINDAFRERLRLLTPAQMRKQIKLLALKQVQLAEQIGVEPETMSRWVTGARIQSRVADNLLRLYFALPRAREMLCGGKTKTGT